MASAAPASVVEVMTPSGSQDFRASWVPLPDAIAGRLLAGPWPCDKGCTEGDKTRIMRALLGPTVGVRRCIFKDHQLLGRHPAPARRLARREECPRKSMLS